MHRARNTAKEVGAFVGSYNKPQTLILLGMWRGEKSKPQKGLFLSLLID